MKKLWFLALLILSVCVSSAGAVAYADFAPEKPSENYLLLDNPTFIAANATDFAVFDTAGEGATDNFVAYRGARYAFPHEVISLNFLGNDLYLYSTDGLFRFDATSSSFTAVGGAEFSGEDNTEVLTSESKLYFHDLNSNSVRVFDSSLNSVASYSGKVFFKDLIAANGNSLLCYYKKNNETDYTLAGFDGTTMTEIGVLPTAATKLLAYNDGSAMLTDGEVIFLTASATLLNRATKQALGLSSVDDIAICGKALFALDGADKRVVKYSLEGLSESVLPTQTACYASKGSGNYLSSPAGLAYGTELIVCDEGNNRLLAGNSAFSLEKATAVCLKNNRLYAVGANTVQTYSVSVEGGATTYELTDTKVAPSLASITDLEVVEDKLYLLSAGELYDYTGSTCKRLDGFSGVRAIASSEQGSFLYVLDQNGISAYTNDMVKQSFALSNSIANIANTTGFCLDYVGNIITLSNNSFTKYTRSAQGYTAGSASSAELSNYLLGSIRAFALGANGKLYFSTSTHAVYAIDTISFVTSTSHSYTPPIIPDVPTLSIAVTLDGAFFYSDYSMFEDMETVGAGKTVVVFGELSDDTKSYVLCGNKTGYIENAFLSSSAFASAPYEAARVQRDCAVYSYPALSAPSTTVKENAELTITGAISVYGSSVSEWLQVTLNGKNGYIPTYNVAPVTPAEKVVVQADSIYLKILTGRIGYKVAMRDGATAESNTIINLNDGERVLLLEDCGEFKKVKFGDKVGYVASANLTDKPLTTAETIGLALGLTTFVVAVLIYIVVYLVRKKQREIFD